MENVLKHKDFYGTVGYSSADQTMFGKIIGINDLVTFEGESVSSLKSAFEEAVDDYIVLCEEVGKPPLKSFKGSFNIRIAPELHQKAFYLAAIKKTSLNSIVEGAITDYVRHMEELLSEVSDFYITSKNN
ncbi:MAG: type II toxin-antitoxin system HicB family antitoxin [Tunicatimonas sp.]|uniref:type II toxin-antitoxin system HicB family antitoxin n=1 Tax=Tunicatimonas sp. TaxID=1940096 RepID=UPI003C7593C4